MNIKNVKATVFEPRISSKMKNTVLADISTYEGNDQEGNPRYSSWNCKFVGSGFELAKTLEDRNKILIKRGKVENTYNKEQEKLYVNVTVFEFDIYTSDKQFDDNKVAEEDNSDMIETDEPFEE